MADAIQTFSVDCDGGLITSLSDFRQAREFPGSARKLINLEPSAETGGYRRIEGFGPISGDDIYALKKLHIVNPASTATPGYLPAGATTVNVICGVGLVAGSLISAFSTSSFYFGNSTSTTYTASQIQVVDATSGEIQITFSPALSADFTYTAANGYVQFTTANGYGFLICGGVVIAPSGALFHAYLDNGPTVSRMYPILEETYYSTGSSLTATAVSSTGVATVTLSNLARTPPVGSIFYASSGTNNIAFEIASVTSAVTGGVGTFELSFDPTSYSATHFYTNYASYSVYYVTPPDLYYDTSFKNQIQYAEFDIPDSTKYSGRERKVLFRHPVVSGVVNISLDETLPFGSTYKIDVDTYGALIGSRQGVGGINTSAPSSMIYHKNQLFFTNGSTELTFTAPYTHTDVSPANGSGSIRIDDIIVSLNSFKDELIIFCETKIYRLVGSTSSDFVLQPLSKNVGTKFSASIQEIGGDLIFLSNSGFRFLSSLGSAGAFDFPIISANVKSEVDNLIDRGYGSVVSAVINDKNQYRVFTNGDYANEYDSDYFTDPFYSSVNPPVGLIATQKNSNSPIEWSEIHGVFINNIGTFRSFSGDQRVIFCRKNDAKIHQMEYGLDFNTDVFTTTYATPYYDFGDRNLRKTYTKLSIYTESDYNYYNFDINYVVGQPYDNSEPYRPTPSAIVNSIGTFDKYTTQLVGAGPQISFTITSKPSSSTYKNPFSYRSFDIEYMLHDRR